MADEEPVDQKRYLEEACKPKCVKPLLEYQNRQPLAHQMTEPYRSFWKITKPIYRSEFDIRYFLTRLGLGLVMVNTKIPSFKSREQMVSGHA